MPKNYPAFIIDRSRRSEASRFTDDFIVCTDKEAGFIARAYAVPKSRRSELAEKLTAPDAESRITYKVIGESLAVVEIVRMLNEPVAHINRIPPLLKKAMKAYLFGEEMAVRRGGMPLDDQIAAVDDVLKMSESQRSRMIDMNGADTTDRFISALSDAKDSLVRLQKLIGNDREQGRASRGRR